MLLAEQQLSNSIAAAASAAAQQLRRCCFTSHEHSGTQTSFGHQQQPSCSIAGNTQQLRCCATSTKRLCEPVPLLERVPDAPQDSTVVSHTGGVECQLALCLKLVPDLAVVLAELRCPLALVDAVFSRHGAGGDATATFAVPTPLPVVGVAAVWHVPVVVFLLFHF